MPIKHHPRGSTLLEVLLATVILCAAVVTISLVFPKTSKVLSANRQSWLAHNFAATRLEELKTQPYALIGANPTSDFASTPVAATCDCSAINISAIPNNLTLPDATPTLVDSGITFTRTVCINLLGRSQAGAWTSACPDDINNSTDLGFKNIRARVTWIAGGQSRAIETETMMARHAN